jgi:hypothetical protein
MKTHKEIDGVYSDEEYLQLFKMMPTDNILRIRLKEFLERGFLYTIKSQKPYVYRSISEYISGFSGGIYELMYQIPFNKLALCLNKGDTLYQAVLKWRFSLGR